MITKLHGFTLIEMSIVLVIIGLIVGGILVGQNLVKAAEVRATVTQVEKFNTAANTFFEKTGYLPGDIPAGPAAQFGLAARGPYPGQGDGNGMIQGNCCNNSSGGSSHAQCSGETLMFWQDLAAMHLIDGNFTAASSTAQSSNISQSTTPPTSSFFPAAKIGNGNMFFVQNGSNDGGGNLTGVNNYFQLAAIQGIDGTCHIFGSGNQSGGSPGLTVAQAYTIDTKIDDGFPGSGKVFVYSQRNPAVYVTNPVALAGSSTTCFDNGSTTSGQMKYSINQNNGANVNCFLEFRLQTGD